MVRIHSNRENREDYNNIVNALVSVISSNLVHLRKAQRMNIKSIRKAYATRVKKDAQTLYRMTRKDKYLFSQYIDIAIASMKRTEDNERGFKGA